MVILTLLLIVGGIALIVYSFARWAEKRATFERTNRTAPGAKSDAPGLPMGRILAGIVLIILGALSTGIVIIPAGSVGVVRTLGSISPDELGAGPHLVVPFVQSVEQVDVKVRAVKVENYTAASKEQQDLFLNLTLNYHVDPNLASEIVQNIGSDFEAKIVTPRFLDIPKSVTDDYATTIVLNSRDEIRQKATQLLREALAPYGFIVDNIALENFGYSAEYNASIEQKQIAEQQVQVERQKLAQQEVIAQQRVAEARGQADAQIERARGEAEANRLVAASLTDEILTNRYIEKITPGVKTILVPSDGGFILDLGGLLQDAPGGSPAPAP